MAVITTALMVVAISVMFRVLDEYRETTFTDFISDTVDAQIEGMTAHHQSGGLIELQNQIRNLASRDGALYYLIFDEEEGFVAGNFRGIPRAPRLISEGLLEFKILPENRLQLWKNQNRTNQDGRAVLVAGKITTLTQGYRMIVARDMKSVYALQKHVKSMSIVMSVFMLAVVLVAFFISFYVVKRINSIAATARNVMETGDLSQRITVENQWDDLGNLSVILNQLLERVETLMHGVRQVSDSIAHDLRTPLSRLRNHLEELKDDMAGCDVSTKKVTRVIDEADHLLNTFHAVLRISNIETGKRHKPFTSVNLHGLVEDVCEMYAPVAEEKGIRFDTQLGAAHGQGDKNLLFQAVANLIDNAIKYTPEGGAVSVHMRAERNGPVLEIRDSGSGIPEAERDKVFRRFYRMESARTSGGNGLGLAMVAAILELHSVGISLEDNHPGLRIRLKFPVRRK